MALAAARGSVPRELPVMAALVSSGLANLNTDDSDSAGYFQIRKAIWDKGEYAGFPDQPELQIKWFLDQARAVRQQRLASGLPDRRRTRRGSGVDRRCGAARRGVPRALPAAPRGGTRSDRSRVHRARSRARIRPWVGAGQAAARVARRRDPAEGLAEGEGLAAGAAGQGHRAPGRLSRGELRGGSLRDRVAARRGACAPPRHPAAHAGAGAVRHREAEAPEVPARCNPPHPGPAPAGAGEAHCEGRGSGRKRHTQAHHAATVR